MRRVVAGLVPAFVKRRLQARATARFLAEVGPPTTDYVAAHGLTVLRGPFAGMHYLDGLEATSGDLVSKLVGAYEAELHPIVARWVDAAPQHVVDVGSAEGYYAVGLASAIAGVIVHAHDIDAVARERCTKLAKLNGLAAQVLVKGECTPATLAEYPATGVALLADCEGYERTLLDPAAAPNLRGWSILVELHEFLDPGITQLLRERFESTHSIELIEGVSRDGSDIPELAALPNAVREKLLGENRPGPMRWMALEPH